MADKKKIMFVIHALGYSGAGKMIVCIANHMCKAGYDVVIYVEEQLGQHYDVEPGVEIFQETEFFTNYYTRHFQEIIQLRKRVKEISPDLVISFQTNQNALSVIATRGRNIPVIVSERGDPYQYHDIVAKLKTWVINHAEGGVFQTKRAMEYYGKKLQERSCVIYNPCPVQYMEIPKWDEREDEIVFVARFDIHQKRQDLMVEAFKKVSEAIPDIKLGFYGDGKEAEIIKKQIDELCLTDRVIFHGLTRNIPETIRTKKMFVMTSDFEGLPNSLIEAMAVGLPCVSTDCSPGGASELIENGVNGVIVPCGDVVAISTAIIDLLTDAQKANTMGLKAQKILDRLEETKIYSMWEEYIGKILD